MPRLGWHVYDAKVLEVSDDLDYLKRKEDLATQDRNDRRQSPTVNNNNDRPATPAAGNDQNGLLHQILGALRAQPQQQLAQPAPQPTPTESVQVVKIGKSLIVPKTCIIQAKAAKTPSAMTMYLVKGTFSKKRLQRSVYAGQRRKGLVPKPSLKKFQVMRDIQDYVLQRFPEFNQSSFGAAVNSCTGLKATATPEVQYEEMVPSDEENE